MQEMRLSKEIQEIKSCSKDLKTPKKKVDALTQRKNASLVKKVNPKDLPQGWTKEKVAMAYHMAGKRGDKENFSKCGRISMLSNCPKKKLERGRQSTF